MCTGAGADSSTSVANRAATLDIDAGENVVCTFTNSQRGVVTVLKTEGEQPLPEGSSWTFTLNGEEQTTNGAGEIAWTDLPPGEYSSAR